MATHDYVIANGTGAAVRSDLNNALAAIVSNNSSSTEPGTTYAYQWWADTNANVLKLRNSANDGWITLRELDGTMLIEDGSASTPGLAFADDVNTGIFSPAADQIGFATGGAERLEIGSSEVVFNDPSNDVDFRVESNGQTHMLFVDGGADAVCIGTSTPGDAQADNLTIADSANCGITIRSGTSNKGQIYFSDATSGDGESIGRLVYTHSDNAMFFTTNSSEGMRLDSSGRLLVGASSSRTVGGNIAGKLQIEGTGTGGSTTACTVTQNSDDSTGGRLMLAKSRGTSTGSITLVQSGDQLGMIDFAGADGTNAGSSAVRIIAEVDGTPGENDMPGRLEFHTTADGASSPTERMRIDSSGNVLINATSAFGTDNEQLQISRSGGGALAFARDDTSIGAGNLMGHISWYGNDSDGSFDQIGKISLEASVSHSTTSKPTTLIFSTTEVDATSPTERFRIDNLGRVDMFSSDGNGFDLHHAETGGSDVVFQLKNGATDLETGTNVMQILADGDIENANNRYTQISDIKFKENIVDASSQWEDLKAIRVVNFNFKAEKNWGTHRQIGVIAQEIETVSPGLICQRREEDGEEYKSVAYSVLHMKAVKALQEAMDRIETLEAKVAALEAG